MSDEIIEEQNTQKRKANRAKKIVLDRCAADMELPRLTESQEAFVTAVLSGMHIKDAYKHSYPSSNLNSNALGVEASRLLRNPKIQLWINACKKLGLMNGAVTFDRWLADQNALIQTCLEEGAYSTAQEGHKTLGKALGYIDKKEEINPMLNPENLLKALARILPPILGSELWRQVEEKLGVVLLQGEVRQMKVIEGTSLGVITKPTDVGGNQ